MPAKPTTVTARVSELHADVAAMRVAREHEVGAAAGSDAKRARIVVEQEARRRRAAARLDDPSIASCAARRRGEDEVQAEDLQRLSVDRHRGHELVAQHGTPASASRAEAVRIVVVVIAEARPLAERRLDRGQRLVQREIEIAAGDG